MATRTWTGGSGDKLFTNTANWSAAVVPTTGDNIIVPRTTHYIDCTGQAAVAFGTLDILEGCYLAIGSTSNPLTGSFTDIRHRGRSGAKLYFTDDASGVSNRILILGEAGADLAELSGALPLLVVMRGKATVIAAATGLTRVIVGQAGVPSADARLTCLSTGTITDLLVYGGTCIVNSILTDAYLTGGTTIRRGSAAAAAISVVNGAQLWYEGTGTVTNLFVGGNSVADFDRTFADGLEPSVGRGAAVTVTNAYRLPGGQIRAQSPLVTTSNSFDYRELSE